MCGISGLISTKIPKLSWFRYINQRRINSKLKKYRRNKRYIKCEKINLFIYK